MLRGSLGFPRYSLGRDGSGGGGAEGVAVVGDEGGVGGGREVGEVVVAFCAPHDAYFALGVLDVGGRVRRRYT